MSTSTTSIGTHAARRGAAQAEAPRPDHGRFLAGEAVVLVLALALAAVVVMDARATPLPGDAGLAVAWQHLILPNHPMTAAIDAVSDVNWPIPSVVLLVVVALLLLALRRWLDLLVTAVMAVLADGSSYLTNELVRRHRPTGHGVHVLRNITNYYSFPSGHVVHAVAVYGILVYLTFRVRRPHGWLWVPRLVLLALIVLMGPSRVLEGEHWPSDVLEGLLYGLFWLVIGTHLYTWAARRFPRLVPANESAPRAS